MLDFLKTILLGIVEGITEWLPISSTGHMILVDEFVKLDMNKSFMDMFFVVIQLGAILAVVVMMWNKIWPFHTQSTKLSPFFKTKNDVGIRKICNRYVYMDKIILWIKILIASLPAAVIGLAFDDEIDEMLTGDLRAYVVATALIVYGIIFIIIESVNKKEKFASVNDFSFTTALLIGVIQCLALVPGTSRSGSTILGAMLLGCSRVASTEFSFFLSIPAMVGGSGIKLIKYFYEGNTISFYELMILLVGMVVAFIVSVLAIKFLVSFVKKHDFKAFGYYRIILGVLVIMYFAFAV